MEGRQTDRQKAEGLTLAGEALDMEVDILHTNHLSLTDLPAAETVDGHGATPAIAARAASVGAVPVRPCWRPQERRGKVRGHTRWTPTKAGPLIRQDYPVAYGGRLTKAKCFDPDSNNNTYNLT